MGNYHRLALLFSRYFSSLERIALVLLGGALVLLPVFFIPHLFAPFQFTKVLFVAVAAGLSLILFSVSRLREGSVSFPNGPLFGVLWLLPLAYLVSSVFSADVGASLLGQSLDVDTFAFALLGATIASLAAVLFRSTGEMFIFYMSTLGVFVLLALFQGIRLVWGVEVLSFGVLSENTANVLGKWNDLGIFFGLAAVLALVTLERFHLSRVAHAVCYAVVLLALFFLALVNLAPVWVVLALFMLGFALSGLSKRLMGKDVLPSQRFGASTISLVVIAVSLAFLFGGETMRNSVATTFNMNYVEARPSWQSTIDVGRGVYREDILFGSGPNTFTNAWARFRPVGINTTTFWNADFTLGVGIIPTAFVTGGLLVGSAWLLLFGVFILMGIRTLVVETVRNQMAHYIALSSFLGALYLWIMSFVYTPNAVILLLAFFLTGMFVAALRSQAMIDEEVVVFDENPRAGLFASLALALCIVGSLAALYIVAERYVGAVLFQRAVILLNTAGDFESAERDALRAANLGGGGREYRFAANVAVAQLSAIVASTPRPTEEAREKFQYTLSAAVQYGKDAVRVEPGDHRNWVALGGVYHTVLPLGLAGSYEGAKNAYERAATLAPSNPSIRLALARLEAMGGSVEGAREQVGKALELKPDYTEAAFFLSQIEVQEGNVNRAVASLESTALLTPFNPIIFFQLGFLKYSKRDNAGAIAALERAVSLKPEYANARYFLGLSYYRVDRNEEAIAQFEKILELNPGNGEIESILKNLQKGKGPFDGSKVAAPEKKRKLPVAE